MSAQTLFEGMEVPMILPNGDTARTRRTDPVTSHWAGDASSKNVNPSHGFVLNALAMFGPKTQPELIDLARIVGARLSDSRIRSAVSELRENGEVEFTGFYRLTESGNRAQVWQLTGGEAA